jgi:hypothetical protein
MNKIQPVSFRNMDEFLDFIPEEEKRIVLFLRQLIFDCIPACTEKLAYNVPFYYLHSRICFIWPPSVPWGNAGIKGVQLGFCKGFLLSDEVNYLEKGDRKQVWWKSFTTVNEIDPDLIRSFLFEAVEIDKAGKKAKK